jgi:hypothetical protein
LIAASPVIGFVAKLDLSADVIGNLLATRGCEKDGSLSEPAGWVVAALTRR